MSTTDTTTAKLTEAFHLVYDVKDTLRPGSPAAVAAHDAIQSIAAMLDPSDRPRRFDCDGRSDGAPVVVSHADWSEFAAALLIAANVNRTVGQHVMAEHYETIAAKYGNA